MKRSLPTDILRFLACLMVILMHSPIAGEGAIEHGAFLTALSYLTTPCVPLFFMVSGALLLKESSNELNAVSWLKKRLVKVVFPTIIFSLFYIFLNGSAETWTNAVLSIPLSTQGHGVLWFMYTLIGLYLITPIIKPWINRATKNEVRLYLGIWLVTLLFPYLGLFVDINTSNTGILYYVTGFVGYYILGYYLTKWGLRNKEYIVLLILTAAILPLPLLNKTFGWNLDFYSAFWYLSAPVCIMTMAWFCTISQLLMSYKETNSIITTISNLCFGVYLVHIFIMRDILWNVNIIVGIDNYYIQTGVVFVLTAILSFGVCWLVSLMPFSQYIIGYKNTKR